MYEGTISAPQPMTKIIIDVDEKFPVLHNAPSVEAVIDIRVAPEIPPDEESLRKNVQASFSDYKLLDSQKEIQFQVQFETGPASNQPPKQTTRDLGWKGLRFRSEDQKYIAQFNRNGFVLSRLQPYQSWSQFLAETMRLWNRYAEFVKPMQILSVGLRYVNLIQMPAGEQFQDYIEVAPSAPKGLEFSISGFMHQDTLAVPDYRYAVNIIKTKQPPIPSSGLGDRLILDIGVTTTESFEPDDAKLSRHLAEMRWLKNKVFFGAIKPKSQRMFE